MPVDELTYVFAPLDLSKSSKDDKGHLTIYGKLTGSELDLDGQACDPSWLKTAVPKWFEIGNLREMHVNSAVGKANRLDEKDDGWYIQAKVVDPLAATKVEEGVYTGLSIGIKRPVIDTSTKALKTAPNGVIAGGIIVEGSLCDRPCLPGATLQEQKLVLAKSAKPKVDVTIPAGMAPETDKGLVRTEEVLSMADGELVKVSTSAGHSHAHTHEDGSHEHAHPHTPLDGHYDHGDGVPHEHAHDPKDPPRAEEGASDAGEGSEGDGDEGEKVADDDAAKAAAQALVAPTFDAGPQAPDELHKATVAKLEANQPPVTAGAPVSMTIEDIQALINKGIDAALAKAKKDPADPHAFVDNDGDGKCDTCGEKREDGMHHKDFGKGTDPDLTKAVPDDPKLERCITDLYGSKDMKAKYPKDEDRKSHAIAICRASLGKDPLADLTKIAGELVAVAAPGLEQVEHYKRNSASPDFRLLAGLTDPASRTVVLTAAQKLLAEKNLLTKQEDGEEAGEVDQSAAYAATCQGLATLITQEAAELAGGSDEYWSLYCLLQALQGLRAFKKGEIMEGEMEGSTSDRGNPMWMEAVPDLVKAIGDLPGAVASEVAKALRPADVRTEKGLPEFDPTDFATTLREELAKAMKPLEGIEALSGRMAKVEETVERIAKSPVPTGPRRTGMQSNGPAPKSTADAHREKAAYYTAQAASMSDTTMAQGFRALASDELAKAAALDGASTTT